MVLHERCTPLKTSSNVTFNKIQAIAVSVIIEGYMHPSAHSWKLNNELFKSKICLTLKILVLKFFWLYAICLYMCRGSFISSKTKWICNCANNKLVHTDVYKWCHFRLQALCSFWLAWYWSPTHHGHRPARGSAMPTSVSWLQYV